MRTTVLLLVMAPVSFAAPPEVAVCRPVEREVTDYADFTGRTEASTTVEVRSRLASILEKVLFKEGTQVKRGDLLFQLDDRVPRAELAKVLAEAAQAEARLKAAEIEYRRMVKLADAKTVSREELEKAAAAQDVAKAAVAAVRASVNVSKLNLEHTRIMSPIDGRIGRVQVDPGNFVRADSGKDGSLATIVVTDPLWILFDVDERTLLRLIRDKGDRDAKVTIGVGFVDQDGYPRKADIDSVVPAVDPATGTARLRAILPNPKGMLVPGQFAKVRLPIGSPHRVLLVPDAAILSGDSSRILVVNDKNFLVERAVKLGGRFDGLRAIESGLRPDEWVVQNPRGRKPLDEIKPRREAAPKGGDRPGEPVAAMGTARPLADFPVHGPAIVVTAKYPGADSSTVEQTVAGPIDAQLNGMDGVVHRVIACADDGELRITLVLRKATDINAAIVQAQKRVALAEPTLPDLVRREGIKVKARSIPLLAVVVTSPDDRHDRRFLAAYAEKQIQDELKRVSGVADVEFYGDTELTGHLRITIDPDRLRALDLKARDILNAIQDQDLSATLTPGRHPTISVSGAVPEPKLLEQLAVKGTAEGRVVYLRDVARIDQVSGWGAATAVDGKACAVLLLSRAPDADAARVARAVRARLVEMAKVFPDGIACKILDAEE